MTRSQRSNFAAGSGTAAARQHPKNAPTLEEEGMLHGDLDTGLGLVALGNKLEGFGGLGCFHEGHRGHLSAHLQSDIPRRPHSLKFSCIWHFICRLTCARGQAACALPVGRCHGIPTGVEWYRADSLLATTSSRTSVLHVAMEGEMKSICYLSVQHFRHSMTAIRFCILGTIPCDLPSFLHQTYRKQIIHVTSECFATCRFVGRV